MQYSLITPKKRSSAPIDLGVQIGRGATAQVFNFAIKSQQYAAKIYKNPENINWDKITQMTEYSYDSSYSFTKKHAWPIGIIQENGTNVGFAMPLFDTSKFLSLDHFYDNILKSSVKDKNLLTLPNLGLLCKNLANVMAEFHKHKIHLIDVKPQNIAVNLENNEVILLDCDGFSIPSINGLRFPGNFVSIDYISPEVTLNKIPPSKLGKKQDLYALAVLIFQILNSGIHPFSGQLNAKTLEINTNDEKAAAGLFAYGRPQNRRIKPHKSSRHKFWPENIRTAFNKTFVEEKRLTAPAWVKVFSDIEERKDYTKCDKFPIEAKHISYRGKGCMQCFIESLEDVTRAPKPNPINPEYVKPMPRPKPNPSAQNGSIGKIFVWIIISIFALFILNEIFVSNSKKTVILTPTISEDISTECGSSYAGVRNCSEIIICRLATISNNGTKVFDTNSKYENYVSEAKRRNLSCGVKGQVIKVCDATTSGVKNCSDTRICVLATIQKPNGEKVFDSRKNYKNYVMEAKRRNLECENKDQISNICNSTALGVKNCSNSFICAQSTELVFEYGKYEKKFYEDPSNFYLNEAKIRNLKCGVKEKLISGICSIEGGLVNCSDTMICWKATIETPENKILFNSDSFSKPYIEEVERRNLNCGVTK